MTKTNFTKIYKIWRMTPSLSGLSWSLGLEAKPLAGIQGAELLEASRFKSYKGTWKSAFWVHSFLFLKIFFSSILLIFSAIRYSFLGAALPCSRGFWSPGLSCSSQGSHFKQKSQFTRPLLRKFENFSLYSLSFSSQAPKFENFQLTSPKIGKFSVHKPPLFRDKYQFTSPTPLPEKKLNAPPPPPPPPGQEVWFQSAPTKVSW